MVSLTKIYTRGGDKGETSLTGGSRISKAELRVEAYGTVDEANSSIGAARLHVRGEQAAMLERIQQDLFDLGADISTPSAHKPGKSLRVTPAQVERLEKEIDAMNAELAPLNSFVLPGGSEAAALLHVARTIVRRAERVMVGAAQKEDINPVAIAYINRLSDHLFVMARYVNDKGKNDILWKPGVNR